MSPGEYVSRASLVVLVVFAAGCVQNPYSLGSDRAPPSGAGGGPAERCDAESCRIDCGAGQCAEPVQCPAGAACHVTCAEGACRGGVSCADDAPCRIDCWGARSCGPLDCGTASSCVLDCAGMGSCPDRIDSRSAATQLTCGVEACAGVVRLNGGDAAVYCEGASSCGGELDCAGSSCALDCGHDASCASACCRAERCTLPVSVVAACP